MSQPEKLPLSKQISYSIGQLGWSTLVNIVSFTLVYFYRPPANAEIPHFVTQVTILVVFNIVTFIAASGRLFDAITDPFIASWSDRSTHPKGRRIPFLKWAAVPAAVFCTLMFFPPTQGITAWNVVWIIATQLLFFLAITFYVTPYFALVAELGHTMTERLNLSTYISITWALGLVLGAAVPPLSGIVAKSFQLNSVTAFQYAVGGMSALAVLMMLVPVFTIDEKRYAKSEPSDVPLMPALKKAFKNKNFIYYVVADFAYFTAITLVNTGILFFTTVLLLPGSQEEGKAFAFLLSLIMVGVSFLFYPAVNLMSRRLGKKRLVMAAFVIFGLVFLFIYFMGSGMGLDPRVQGFIMAGVAAIPIAFLGVLPNAILADIAETDARESGVNQAGMFFAARTLMQKLGVTAGVFIFAMLTTFGKDPGNDLGIRLAGPVGLALCVVAAVVFMRFNEDSLKD